MKKILLLFTLLFSTLILAACGKKTLKFYSPGAYVDKSVFRDFEKENNVSVKHILFDSNEVAITQMEASSFDVVVPSDYAIEQLTTKSMLHEIDWNEIKNLEKSDITTGLKDMLDDLKNQVNGFDILKYGVPYFWGNVGILYDKNVVKVEDLENEQWNILRNPNYQIAFYDSSRDSFMSALKQLGYSMNTDNLNELMEAEKWLNDAKGDNISYKGDQILEEMQVQAHDLAVVYSGDAIYLMQENESLDYYVPTVGTNVWVDAMVIPKTCSDVELAHKFISYMSSYDVVYANTEEVGYSAIRDDVVKEVTSIDGPFFEQKEYYDIEFRIGIDDEIFRYNQVNKTYTDEAWNRIRVVSNNMSSYIVMGVIVVVIAIFMVSFKVYRDRKRRRD